MAITFDDAKKKAKELLPGVSRANDFGTAYAFYDKQASNSDGGNHALVIMKDSGKARSLTSFLMDGGERTAPKRVPMSASSGAQKTVKRAPVKKK